MDKVDGLATVLAWLIIAAAAFWISFFWGLGQVCARLFG